MSSSSDPVVGGRASGCERGSHRTGARQVDDDVAQDREQPRPQRAQRVVEALGGLPGPHERLLHRLFGEAPIAQRPQREPVQLGAVRGVYGSHTVVVGEDRLGIEHSPEDTVALPRRFIEPFGLGIRSRSVCRSKGNPCPLPMFASSSGLPSQRSRLPRAVAAASRAPTSATTTVAPTTTVAADDHHRPCRERHGVERRRTPRSARQSSSTAKA